MGVRRIPLGELRSRLDATGLYGVFARHLLPLCPDAPMLAADPGAFAVSGRPFGRFSAAVDATIELATFATASDQMSAYCPHAHLPAVARALPSRRCSEDLLFSLDEAPSPVQSDAELRWLDPDLGDLVVPDAVRARLPPPPVWKRAGLRYAGAIDRGALVAILDATVDDGSCVALQQAFTSPEHRGRGLGSALLAHVSTDLRRRGRRPIWICAATNQPSQSLALRVGFKPQLTLGCIESE
jgi:GNAT superfamily N-acetyltransferase